MQLPPPTSTTCASPSLPRLRKSRSVLRLRHRCCRAPHSIDPTLSARARPSYRRPLISSAPPTWLLHCAASVTVDRPSVRLYLTPLPCINLHYASHSKRSSHSHSLSIDNSAASSAHLCTAPHTFLAASSATTPFFFPQHTSLLTARTSRLLSYVMCVERARLSEAGGCVPSS